MAKGVPHYFKDGTEHKGGTHKMPDGSLHSGKVHGKTSKRLYHFKDLSKTAQKKASGKKQWRSRNLKSLSVRGLNKSGALNQASLQHKALKLLVKDIFQKKQLRVYQRKSMLQHREQKEKEQKLANSLLSNQKELRKKQKTFAR